MSIQQKYKPELHDLLAQLARFFSANETRISAEQVSKCLGRLSAFESSALNRLFFLLYQSKVGVSYEPVLVSFSDTNSISDQ